MSAAETILGVAPDPACPGCGSTITQTTRCSTCGLDLSSSRTLIEKPAAVSAREQSALQRVTGDPAFSSRFQNWRKIGEGSYGIILAAHDRVLNREVAIKLLIESHPEEIARFQRESAILQKLQHPSIVSFLEAQVIAGVPIILMELVSGVTLTRYIEERGKLSHDDALRIIRAILEGLGVAHAHGVLHRDIKNDNVLVLADGSIKILDFGFAKDVAPGGVLANLTAAGTLIGTPAYMSPELCQGMAATPASDIYSVGVVLYQMLAGKPPFTGESLGEIISKQLMQPPPSLKEHQVPEKVDQVVQKALAKHPGQRYPDAPSMLADLPEVKKRITLQSVRMAIPSPRKTPRFVVSSALCLVMLGFYFAFFRLDAFSNSSLDLLSALEPNAPGPVKSAVVIIGVDLPTMRNFGLKVENEASDAPAPILDRIFFVKLLERLRPLQPAAIGLDFLFQTPRDPITDQKLAEEIGKCGNVVVTGSWVSSDKTGLTSWAAPLPAIQKNARAVGYANVPPDEDEIIRRFPLKPGTDPEVDAFSLALAKHVLHTDYVSWENGVCKLNNQRPFPDREVPADEEGNTLYKTLKGPKGEGPFVVIPAMKFMSMPEDKIPKDLIKDRVILVGTTDRLYGDFHRTPLTRFSVGELSDFSGVEILGSFLHNILENRSLQPISRYSVLGLLVLLVLFNAFSFSRMGTFGCLTLFSIEALATSTAAYSLYRSGLLVSIADVIIPLALSGIIGSRFRAAAAAPEKIVTQVTPPVQPAHPAPVRSPPAWSAPPSPISGADSTIASSQLHPFSPAFVARYRIEHPLGKGAMGEVFLATQIALDRKVAIKKLTTLSADQVERFRVEGKLLSKLNHPRIIGVFDAGEDNRVPFLVCEYVEGETLRDYMRRGPLGLDEVVRITTSILEGIAVAHSQKILHRDIKPDNIFITNAREIKIGDFGLAKLGDQQSASMTRQGMIMGTPTYMSPEQARGKEADERSDLYAVGVMLYEMICGRPPFQGESAYQVVMMQIGDQPPHPRTLKPDLSLLLGALIMRALDKSPDARFQTASDFARDLQVALKSTTSPQATIMPESLDV